MCISIFDTTRMEWYWLKRDGDRLAVLYLFGAQSGVESPLFERDENMYIPIFTR